MTQIHPSMQKRIDEIIREKQTGAKPRVPDILPHLKNMPSCWCGKNKINPKSGKCQVCDSHPRPPNDPWFLQMARK